MFKLILISLMFFATGAHADPQVGLLKTYHAMASYKGKPYKAITINVNMDGTAEVYTTDANSADLFTVQVESIYPVKMKILLGHNKHEYAGGTYLIGLQPGEWSELDVGNFNVKMERVENTVEIAQ